MLGIDKYYEEKTTHYRHEKKYNGILERVIDQ